MADAFSNHAPTPRDPAVKSVALDVSSTDQTLTDVPTGFLATGGTTLIAKLRDDAAAITMTVIAGVVYPMRFISVTKSGTDATGYFLYAK